MWRRQIDRRAACIGLDASCFGTFWVFDGVGQLIGHLCTSVPTPLIFSGRVSLGIFVCAATALLYHEGVPSALKDRALFPVEVDNDLDDVTVMIALWELPEFSRPPVARGRVDFVA